jgi:dCMP deaminase
MSRKDYLDWNHTFMTMAEIIALRSKDPSTQVGCCIVNTQNIVAGMGYNGFPRGCEDDEFPWTKTGEYHETKYAYVVHAEQNAILNSHGRDLKGSTMYVTKYPCNECAKFIIQVGISQVYYMGVPTESSSTIAARRMFKSAGIEVLEYRT